MDLRERLKELSRKKEQSKSEIISDLRKRLDRLLRPEKFFRRKEYYPIEKIIEGEIISTHEGEVFYVNRKIPQDFRLGEMTLYEILNVPTYPAHLLIRDERFKDLELRRALFIDTETTGLSGGTGTFAFLIGLGFFDRDYFLIKQFFMRDFSEEKASLHIVKDIIESFEFLITFNGRHYDIPLLETRFILSRIGSRIREIPNFDLLYPSRRIWKGAYENCRLITLESNLLGVEREDDIPSEWIPSLYFEYLKTRDGRKISRVFYHNQMDILGMVALLGRIHLIYHDPKAARPRKGIEHFSLGKLFWDHGNREKAIPCFEEALKRCDDELAWEVMKWLSLAFKKTGKTEKAKFLWEEMISWPNLKDTYPYVELAKYYEHRVKDFEKALEYVDQALRMINPHQEREIQLLLQRRERLEHKLRIERFY